MKWLGLDKVESKLRSLAYGIPEAAKAEIEFTGRMIEADAKAAAPVDTGKLRQSIHYEPTNGGFGDRLSVNVPYGYWVEFGTGALVQIPDGWEGFAAQFRGKGIREVNLPARPYIIPAFRIHTSRLPERILKRFRIK